MEKKLYLTFLIKRSKIHTRRQHIDGSSPSREWTNVFIVSYVSVRVYTSFFFSKVFELFPNFILVRFLITVLLPYVFFDHLSTRPMCNLSNIRLRSEIGLYFPILEFSDVPSPSRHSLTLSTVLVFSSTGWGSCQ